MTLNNVHLLTRVQIWHPRYSDKHGVLAEPKVLIAKYKVHHGSSVLLVEFTKAKSLIGQRFCITRDAAQRYPVETNGKIECYSIPISALEPWETYDELNEIAMSVFNH